MIRYEVVEDAGDSSALKKDKLLHLVCVMNSLLKRTDKNLVGS
jgi:hypothetical protein